MTTTLDIDTVQAFLLVAELQGFTRAAEALGTTQAAISMKLQRLETVLGKRLVERSPRAVRLTADGAAFLHHARALIEVHDRALAGEKPARQQLTLGISDHAAGPELVPLLERLHAMASQLALSVTIGFSREMLDAYDGGELDAVIVRQEGSRRGGEKLTEDEFGWFAAKRFVWPRGDALPLATLAPPCGVRALAVRALDKAGIAWTESFVGGGVTAVVAAALAGLAVAPLVRRIAPPGLVDIGPAHKLPRLGTSKVMLHSKVGDPAKLAALRTLAATFRSVASAA
ncbi:DNA-binding transcriptional LysR family regulator [Bradyrhizobium japonicum]|jgi:DNA-binding transcriptional LysR family regulator|uniref:DNA-binding transcriptional LysR family regulator n=1 Tax=Bradyrhizobium elkanii TaxID=29448 RepID=A0A4Q4JZD4_BRAEL|nr:MULTISPECIES: LysR family transcriptional regulator [Bradyrhizobium]MBP1296742.1 DNA-binding transcriptional LysR family regulator [Bradyrhizobium elkanii]MCP1731733.1 DNA-binding transcriptional LysR family regulator [Bradyrhizobium elkanii]MCP1932451.1 DNA-binding transcriptional LysR family regulator [Bradyrhizobium elkanii]MCP1969230.1 DNA-binding transcriptional LysR family regulator [Bradyrhizobium elkanii]MCS3479622.1 DNA-binding transcriptional LysR family regulator [Bradyrhizobium 